MYTFSRSRTISTPSSTRAISDPPHFSQVVVHSTAAFVPHLLQIRRVARRRTSTSSGTVDASVFAYQWAPDTVYHFVMVTRGGMGIGPFVSMVQSIRRITPSEAAAIRPRIIDVVTVRPGDTVQTLASRMAYPTFRLERFLSLNGLQTNSALAPGQKVKLVVYGTRRA